MEITDNMAELEEKGALRFDNDKIRHDLLDPHALNELAKVLTFGSKKYASRNWEKGMLWSRVLGSLKRHLNSLERGEDYDPETTLLHASHILCNAMFLVNYYKNHPELDDRPHKYLIKRKIGLDIDDVLADFVGHFKTRFGIKRDFHHWNDPEIRNNISQIADNEEFWMNIPVLTKSEDLPFEPHCYITTRLISPEITQKWLDINLFPKAPLYSTRNETKVELAKKSGIDVFVDDRFEYFQELNNAGVMTYLFDAPHNRKYDVGYRRIKSLNELK